MKFSRFNCNSTDRVNFGRMDIFNASAIEIINNTRGDIEGKIWERGYWGANSSPGCSLIHDVPGKKVILDEFFSFWKCFSS